MNVSQESANENDSMEKLFVSKPVEIGFTIPKNSEYDNLKLEQKDTIINLVKIVLMVYKWDVPERDSWEETF